VGELVDLEQAQGFLSQQALLIRLLLVLVALEGQVQIRIEGQVVQILLFQLLLLMVVVVAEHL
jgi:hypothetical protein